MIYHHLVFDREIFLAIVEKCLKPYHRHVPYLIWISHLDNLYEHHR